MSEPPKAVFLSYASQDAEAARRICEALRAAGVAVWFDQSELRGGDAWDQSIRKQIKECALFVPVVSANTQARREGYFRLEWKLADDRTHLMAKGTRFILPICVDDTKDWDAIVPDAFMSVQWTRLPGGNAAGVFAERVKKLLAGEVAPVADQRSESGAQSNAGQISALPQENTPRSWSVPAIMGAALIAAVAAYFALRPRPGPEENAKPPANTPTSAAPAASPSTPTPAPLTEAQKLVAQMWEIYDRVDDVSNEEWALAQDLGAQATRLEPLNADAWAAYANVTLTPYIMGYDSSVARRERALKLAERATSLTPDATQPRLALANCYRFGDAATRAEAERIVRELVAREPANRRVLRMAGNVMRTQGKFDESVAFYDRANALPGGDAIALLSKEYTLKVAGRFAEAEAALNQSFALHAGPAAYVRKLFYLLYVYDDLDGAAEVVAKVPGPFLLRDEATFFVSSLWLWRHDAEKCIATLRQFDGDELYGVPKGYLIGHAFEISGRFPAAELEWRAALKNLDAKLATAPNDANALYGKAYLLACLGEKTEADRLVKIYEQMTSPAGTTLDFLRADILVRLGRNDETLATIETGTRDPVRSTRDLWWRGSLRHDPVFDPLRATPQFQALLAKLNESKLDAAPATPRSALNPARADDKSVAVLAFANLSDDKANEYFSDGISEELLNVLAKVPGLKVTARTSAFYFKGKNLPIPEIAQKLGVAYVIEGSVQRAGDNVRITAQLIKAADGFHVWSEHFDRELKNVFALQDEIAGLIANQLSLKLGASSAAATATVNPQALEFYLQASQLMRLRDTIFTSTDRVEALLNRALTLEPNFARAQAMLSEIWAARGSLQSGAISRFSQRNSPERARIEAKARQAIALDPTAPEAHLALSLGRWIWWDRAGSEEELRTALSLNPSFAPAHRQLGYVAMDDGRMDDALAEMKMAVQLDPFSQDVIESCARVLHVAGRYTEAIATYDRALALADSEIAREHKAYALAQLGQKEAAVALARSLTLEHLRFRPFAVAGARAEAEKMFPTMEPENRVYYLFMLGRTEAGLAALEPAEMRSTYLHDVLFEPWYDPVREDPRFKKFLETLGVTEAHARAQAWRKAHPPEKQEVKP